MIFNDLKFGCEFSYPKSEMHSCMNPFQLTEKERKTRCDDSARSNKFVHPEAMFLNILMNKIEFCTFPSRSQRAIPDSTGNSLEVNAIFPKKKETFYLMLN